MGLLRAGRLGLGSGHPLCTSASKTCSSQLHHLHFAFRRHSHSPPAEVPQPWPSCQDSKQKGFPTDSSLPGSGSLTLPTVGPRLCSLNILSLQLRSKESSVPRLTEERPPNVPPPPPHPKLKEASTRDNKLYQPSNKNQNISPLPP